VAWALGLSRNLLEPNLALSGVSTAKPPLPMRPSKVGWPVEPEPESLPALHALGGFAGCASCLFLPSMGKATPAGATRVTTAVAMAVLCGLRQRAGLL